MSKSRILAILYLFLGLAFNASADHIIGSEITYVYNGSNSYTVYTRIYRNCNDCKLNGNGGGGSISNCNDIGKIDIYGYDKIQSKYVVLGNTSTTRISISDKTQLCPGEKSTCQNAATYSYGYEEHLFQSTIDLSNHLGNDYSEFKFSLTIDARSAGISSSPLVQNHFNFCYINTAVAQQTSPASNGIPFNRVNTNSAIYQSVASIHSNFDSVSYNLDSAYISEKVANSYPVGHSPSKPVAVISGNDYKAYKPEGMYLNSETGQLIFTPTVAGDIGVFVVVCKGYKKIGGQMQLVCITRKDFECIVSNGNNNSPYFFGLLDDPWQACEGEVFGEDIYYKDDAIGLLQDTVYISQLSSDKYKWTLNTVKDTFPPFRTSSISWLVPPGSAQEKPHQFTIIANDSNCPKPGISLYTYRIKVNRSKPITATKKQLNCNVYEYTAVNAISTDFVRFSILDSNKNEVAGTDVLQKSATLTFPSKGKWYVKVLSLEINGSCPYVYLDSITLSDFKYPEIDLGANQKICYNSLISLDLNPTIYDLPATYQWMLNGFDISNNSSTLDSSYKNNQHIIVKVVDNKGCTVTDTVSLTVKPKWDNTLKDTGICVNSHIPFYLPLCVKDTAALVNITFSGTNVSGKYFSAVGLPIGSYTIKVNVQDTVNCFYTDSFTIEIGNPFNIISSPLGIHCQKGLNVNLDGLANPSPGGGTWSLSSNPNWITNKTYRLDLSDSGTYPVKYSVFRSGCKVDTVLPIKVLLSPKLTVLTALADSICQNTLPFKIQVQESPTNYLINGKKDSIFDASSYDDSAKIFISRTHGINTCLGKFEKTVIIDSIITTKLMLSAAPICFEQDTLKLSLTDNNYKSQWGTSGLGNFNKTSDSTYTYLITSSEKSALSSIPITVSLKSINTCPNKLFDTTILQNPAIHIRYDSFLLNHCVPGKLGIRIKDLQFTYYDSVQWFKNGVNEIGNGFSNNKHTFNNLSEGQNNFTIIPYKHGCKRNFDTSASIFGKPRPDISASPKEFYSARYPVIDFRINNFVPSYAYRWDTDPRYTSLEGVNPYKFTMPGDTGKHTFYLYTTSDKGCKDTLIYTALCLPQDWIFVPNAFTPNNDGPVANELFKPEGRVSSNYHFQIFNMWGEKLFETTDINAGWNGKYENKIAETGSYFYVVEFIDDVGRPNLMKGSFLLLY